MDTPLSAENYAKWRRIHTDQFGNVFSEAFEDNETAQVILTAALIHMSQRRFTVSDERLASLEDMCVFDFDKAALTYFRGLNYEMLENEAAMNACYDALLGIGADIHFSLAFHPYYRTAKFAQREAECSKALYYYQKALRFYEHAAPSAADAAVAGCLLFDYATVCLYMHRYDLCEQALALSRDYAPCNNPQRTYVAAVLHAVKGEFLDAEALLSSLPVVLRTSGTATVTAIQNKTDLHYGIVPQDKGPADRFLQWMHENQASLHGLAEQGALSHVEDALCKALTNAFPFMNKPLACRVTVQGRTATVHCKTYYVKTLAAEYSALCSALQSFSPDWHFVAVDEFTPYPLQG